MNFNKEELSDQIALYVQMPKCTQRCPVCKQETSMVYEYRIQKIKHLNGSNV